MAVLTHSKFFFGHTITSTNFSIDFSEGGGELQASIDVGAYSLTDFLTAIAAAMNSVGGQVYSASVDRSTRLITISAAGTFELLITTGTRVATTAYTLMGFTGADVTGSASYEGDSVSGSEYTTQFKLQDYVDKDDFQDPVDASVNVSTSGVTEVVRFGDDSFFEMNFKFITDRAQANGYFRNRPTGIADFRTFIQYIVTKAPVEFMPNEDAPALFSEVILERTPQSRAGVGYKLREMLSRGLVGFFQSGVLVFRVTS